MATDYPALTKRHREFIAKQHIFFTASAVPGSRVNLSPRSTDCLRVIGDNSVAYLDRTGSGNVRLRRAVLRVQARARPDGPLVRGEGPHGLVEYRKTYNTTNMDGAPAGYAYGKAEREPPE